MHTVIIIMIAGIQFWHSGSLQNQLSLRYAKEAEKKEKRKKRNRFLWNVSGIGYRKSLTPLTRAMHLENSKYRTHA